MVDGLLVIGHWSYSSLRQSRLTILNGCSGSIRQD